MREVCRVRGWEIPVEFSLNPPNSPAASSPRPVMVLSGPQRVPSRSNLPCPSPHGTSPWVPLALQPESPVLIPDAMDSHMHLDRSLRRLRMDPRMGIQELLARRPRLAPKQEINVVGGVGVAPSLQSIPTSPKAATAGESNSLDRRSK
jgi:hypothetical protein